MSVSDTAMTRAHRIRTSAGRRVALLTIVFAVLLPVTAAVGVAQDEDPAIEAELDRIARETAILRELAPLADIEEVMLSRDELLTSMPEIIAEEIDREEAEAQSRAFAALGLIPEGTDLFALHERLLGEQAMGFYDPLTDEMLVITGEDPAVTEYFYAHEVVHALQDAYLDPTDLMEDLTGLSGDEALAALALYEGDASMASNAYLDERPALAVALLREAQIEFPELDAAPAAVSVVLVFPYTSGLSFVARLHDEGGWERVNAAYADPPASTEQILHPVKYLDRDEPSLVALPTAETALGDGWRVVAEDTLGELQTALLLAALEAGQGFDGITGALRLPEAARNAAAGWDGDRFALWADGDGRETLVWRSVWDTPRDARAFSRALAQYENARWGGVFNGESPDDVALVTTEVAARIVLAGQTVLYVQAPDLPLADAALAALQTAPPPDPAPGPD